MDILFVRNLFRPADFGGNRYPWEVTRRLVARGHTVRVVTPKPGGPLPGPTPVELHHYPVSRRTPLETFFTNALFSRIAVERQILRRRPDVIVFSSYDNGYGYLVAPGHRIPTAYIYHSSFYSPAVDRVGRKAIPLRWAHAPLARFLTHVERTIFDRADRIVAVSPFSRREIEARLGHPDERIVVIPTGADLELFSPGDRAAARTRLGIPADARLLVTAGRLAPVKRYDRAIDATAILARTDPRYRLLVVGNGPERAQLEERARTHGDGRVTLAGPLDGDDLVAAYRAADVVLCTSDFENWSLALLEAMASGAVVVGTPRGSVPDMISMVDPALVSTDVEPDAIARAVALVMARPEAERAALAARAREQVASRYSWDSTVTALERELRRLVR
jgi:glycosyltransferase involved in cell wall biosynthesis